MGVSRRELYEQRKKARRCVDCDAGLQERDVVRCVECFALGKERDDRYRKKNPARMTARATAWKRKNRERVNRYEREERARRHEDGLCRYCNTLAIGDTGLCAVHVERNRERAREWYRANSGWWFRQVGLVFRKIGRMIAADTPL